MKRALFGTIYTRVDNAEACDVSKRAREGQTFELGIWKTRVPGHVLAREIRQQRANWHSRACNSRTLPEHVDPGSDRRQRATVAVAPQIRRPVLHGLRAECSAGAMQ